MLAVCRGACDSMVMSQDAGDVLIYLRDFNNYCAIVSFYLRDFVSKISYSVFGCGGDRATCS